MTKRIEGTTPFFNSNEQESKENLNILLPIFEKAVNAITRPLNEEIQPLQNAVDALNKKRLEVSILDEERPKKRICSNASFSNLNVQESKENLNILPPIFEKTVNAIARPLAEITQLTNTNSEESINLQFLQKIVKSLATNKEGYEGSLIDGQRQDGELFWSNGNVYEGEFFNNFPEGYGKLIYNTGITYVGEFHQGQYHGQGTLTTYEGEYVGEFKYGSFDGSGTLSYSNGDIFTGNYINGIRQGQGTLTYMEGGSYAGRYRNGIRHGLGTLTSAAGDVYVGGFRNGVFNGYGKLTFANGNSPKKGRFANNRFVSKY